MFRKIYKTGVLGVAALLCSQAYAQNDNGVVVGTTQDVIAALKKTSDAPNQRSAKPKLKIAGSLNLNAVVNYGSSNANGDYYVGSIDNQTESNFFIEVKNNKVEGQIILKATDQAYTYYTKDGKVYLKTADIDDLVCTHYDQDESAPKRNANARLTANSAAVLSLQSLPGAPAVAYLDFDGEYVSGTYWNSGNPINAAASGMSDADVQEAWELVSEDMRAFNINVTTDINVFRNAPAGRRTKCIFTPTNTAAPGAGGVAYVNSFSWTNEQPCWVFILSGKSGGEAASHEIGHTFGLSHDGRTSPSEGYFAGHGNWAPIMGVGYYKPISQWSKGEYNSANNKEDDLSIITKSANGFGYRPDDYADNTTGAASLVIASNGTVNASQNKGVISRTNDVDYFKFTTSGGNITLNFNPAARHGDLDILVRLFNSANTQLATSNASGLATTLTASLAAGTYYIAIDGTGAGNPASDGYSDYASLGQYFISGTVPNVVAQPTYATVYKHCGYDASGYAINLPLGNYTTAQLTALGVANDDISSVKVAAGYELVLFANDNFTGTSVVIKGNNDCLVNNNFNDQASSAILRVQTVSQNQLPTVSLTSPANGASFNAPANVTITANASDPDGSIARVEFYNGSTKIGEDNTSPYSLSATFSAGTYSLKVVAFDNVGASASSSTVSIQVKTVSSGCTAAAWNSSAAYVQGNRVSYNGILYEAKWWTQGERPDLKSGQWDVWKSLGACAAPAKAAIVEPTFSAYPNPMSNELTLSFPSENDIYTVVVISPTSGVVATYDQLTSGTTVDVSSLESGVYVLKISSNNGYTKVQRIVKE